MLSIVVPTFNEGGNVIPLIERIHQALDTRHEIVFVDDSTDSTPDILREVSYQDPAVRYVHRENRRGLGTAVVDGIGMSRGDIVSVLDADLQHPPELLPEMLACLENGTDIVVASRFVPGGSDGGLGPFRKLVSFAARGMARLALHRSRSVHDPTAGYFAFKKHLVEDISLAPIGWKILLELIAKAPWQTITEVPYAFAARSAGESKMSLKEQWNYLKHLVKLVSQSPEDRRFALFLVGGGSGVIVNFVVYAGILHLAAVDASVAGALSAVVATSTNFIFHDRVTWREVDKDPLWVRYPKFFLISLAAIGIDVGVLTVLFHGLLWNSYLANLIGIASGTLWNFLASRKWAWRTSRGEAKPSIIVMPPGGARSLMVQTPARTNQS